MDDHVKNFKKSPIYQFWLLIIKIDEACVISPSVN
jgi:hypothetical protein